MDLRWEDYHWFNVNMLSVVGLWPCDNKFVIPLKRFVGGFFIVFGCFSQLAAFFSMDCTRTLFLKNVSCLFVGFSLLLKYISFIASGESIKRLTEIINDDWESLSSNKEEIRIIEKYVERGKYYTMGFAILIWPTGLCLVGVPFYPIVLDMVMPLEESRNRSLPMKLEMFFDQQEYFFVAAFLFDSLIVVGGLVFVSIEAMIIVYIQHACLLFEVTSWRIKKLLHSTGATNLQTISNDAIAQVVNIHCRAIRIVFMRRIMLLNSLEGITRTLALVIYMEDTLTPHRHCNTIRETLAPPYLALLAFGILSVGAYLLRCTETLASHEYTEFLTSAMFSIAILGYIFYITASVQVLLDLSGDLFNVLYESEWYTYPTSIRKLVLFCMLKTVKPVKIDMHNLFFPSYEGFCLIARMAMSYVTALYSI